MEASVTELLRESLVLMVVGMSIVFVFLLILVGMLQLMSAAILRWAPEEAAAAAHTPHAHGTAAPAAVPAGGHADPRRLAAIAAALHRYRRRHRA